MSGGARKRPASGLPARSNAISRATALYQQYEVQVYATCLRRLGDRQEAEDAVQETYMKAWRALEGGVEVGKPLPWLLTIADNVCSSRLRRLRFRPPQTELVDAIGESPTREGDMVDGLMAALDSLPARQRHAFLRRELQGHSYHEISVELGISQAASMSLVHRARRAIASALRDAGRKAPTVFPLPEALRSIFEGGATTAAVAGATAVLVVSPQIGARPSSDPPTHAPQSVHGAVPPAASTRASPSVRRIRRLGSEALETHGARRRIVLITVATARRTDVTQPVPGPIPSGSIAAEPGDNGNPPELPGLPRTTAPSQTDAALAGPPDPSVPVGPESRSGDSVRAPLSVASIVAGETTPGNGGDGSGAGCPGDGNGPGNGADCGIGIASGHANEESNGGSGPGASEGSGRQDPAPAGKPDSPDASGQHGNQPTDVPGQGSSGSAPGSSPGQSRTPSTPQPSPPTPPGQPERAVTPDPPGAEGTKSAGLRPIGKTST